MKEIIKDLLSKDKRKFVVYYRYTNADTSEVFTMLEVAGTRTEAKKKANLYIKNNATPGDKYKFLKVEEVK